MKMNLKLQLLSLLYEKVKYYLSFCDCFKTKTLTVYYNKPTLFIINLPQNLATT